MQDISKYVVISATVEDIPSIFNLLSDVIDVSRDVYRRKLEGTIESGVRLGKVFLLKYEDVSIGTYVTEVYGSSAFIVHGYVIPEYRHSYGSVLIFDFLLNDLFKDKSVFVYGSPPEIYNLLVSHHSQANRIKPGVKERVRNALNYMLRKAQ